MHFYARLIAMILTVGLMPGAAEAVENSVHLVREGHLAHVSEHNGHTSDEAPADDEHGCNSVFHACACHVSTSFIVRAELAEHTAPRMVSASIPTITVPSDTVGAASGELASLLRPPIQ